MQSEQMRDLVTFKILLSHFLESQILILNAMELARRSAQNLYILFSLKTFESFMRFNEDVS